GGGGAAAVLGRRIRAGLHVAFLRSPAAWRGGALPRRGEAGRRRADRGGLGLTPGRQLRRLAGANAERRLEAPRLQALVHGGGAARRAGRRRRPPRRRVVRSSALRVVARFRRLDLAVVVRAQVGMAIGPFSRAVEGHERQLADGKSGP